MALRSTIWWLPAVLLAACNGIDSPFKRRISQSEAEAWIQKAEDTDRQRMAVNLIGASDRGALSEHLVHYRRYLQSDDPMVRAAAARAMGRNAPVDDAGLLVELLTAGSPVNGPAGSAWDYRHPPMVRWEAARALQRLHAPRAVTTGLITALDRDPDADVRRACAEALGQYAEPPVYAALVAALMRDRDYGVVEACAESLSLLTGQNFGEDGSAWLDWETRQANPFKDRGIYKYPTFRRNPFWWEFPDLLFPPANRPQVPRGLARNE